MILGYKRGSVVLSIREYKIRTRFVMLFLILCLNSCGSNLGEKSILIKSTTEDWSIVLKVTGNVNGTSLDGSVANKSISNKHGLSLLIEPIDGVFYKDKSGVLLLPDEIDLNLDPGEQRKIYHKSSTTIKCYDLPNGLTARLVARKGGGRYKD